MSIMPNTLFYPKYLIYPSFS